MMIPLMYEDPFYDVNYVYAGLLALKYLEMYTSNREDFVPRYIAHDFEYLRCDRVSTERHARLLRVGLNRRHHAGALGSKIRLGRRGQRTSGKQQRQEGANGGRRPAPRNNGMGRRASAAPLPGARTSPEPRKMPAVPVSRASVITFAAPAASSSLIQATHW